MTREGIHRRLANHAEEVQPMLDRPSWPPRTRPATSTKQPRRRFTNAGRRFKWTSELERDALLAQLGHDVASLVAPALNINGREP